MTLLDDKALREAKTYCTHGHEYTPENTYISPSGNGFKQCKKCRNEYAKTYRKLHPVEIIKIRNKMEDNSRFGGNREKAIQRDGGECVRCGMTRQAHREIYGRDITVDHIDGLGRYTESDKKNNDISNLQTLCCKCHGSKDGARASKHSFRKISDDDVRAIRNDTRTAKEISLHYNASVNYVRSIRKRIYRADVPDITPETIKKAKSKL